MKTPPANHLQERHKAKRVTTEDAMPRKAETLAGLLEETPLLSGVPRWSFIGLIVDCTMCYARKVEAGRVLTYFKKEFKEESLRRSLRYVKGLEEEKAWGDRFGPTLTEIKKLAQFNLGIAHRVENERKRLDRDGYFRCALHDLILALYATRHLVDTFKYKYQFLPGFLTEFLNEVPIPPPRGKKWSSYSAQQSLKRAGGAGRSDCYAVCLFSTDVALRGFRPKHRMVLLMDRAAHAKPQLSVLRETKRRGSTLNLWNVATLAANERGESITKSQEIAFLPGSSKIRPCGRRSSERILSANGRLLRGLPILMGQRSRKNDSLSQC